MKHWLQSGNDYHLRDVTSQVDRLPVGVYAINEDAFGTLSLERRSDSFGFSHKVYGKDQPFIERVLKTYNNTTNNLGILLNGIKGTGKSVTAKILCNQMNLPVILVDDQYDNLVSFLADLPQDIVVMLDEYEKVYGDSGKLLGAMDGIDASSHRRTFILTTNESYINNNMLNRPSRIRYVKNYNNLDITVVREIIADLLIYREYEEDLVTVLRDMTHITIDLLISIIKEINIHNEPASSFSNIFNVDFKNPHFDIFEEDGRTEVAKNITIPYGRNIFANPGKWLNSNVYYEDSDDNDILIGIYKGYKNGHWNFDTVESGNKNYVIKKASTTTFYAYE